MTSVPSWDTGGPTDAELARAAAGGDRRAFAEIYDRYADRLHDFCVGMLRDRDGAADCVQDAFCTAATHLTQLREPDKLRPWLYSIARNEALRRLRERRRETPSEELPDAMSREPGPDTLAARTELADLVADAAGGLSDRDRSVLELAYRHGLDGPELAEALGVSPGNANKMVYRLRQTIENSLGALLVSRRARNNPNGCPDLAGILGDWDGRFSVLMRKRIARHIESCPACDEQRRQMITPAALLGAVPVFIPAPLWLRERTLGDIRLDSLATPIAGDTGGSGGAGVAGSPGIGRDRRARNMMALAAVIVAVLLISLGLTIVWRHSRNAPVAPIDVGDTASLSSTTPSAPTPSNPAPAQPTATEITTVPAVTAPSVPVTPSEQPRIPLEPPVVMGPPPPPPPPPPPVTPELPPPPPPVEPPVSLPPLIPPPEPPPSINLQPIPRPDPAPPQISIIPRPPQTPGVPH